MNKRRRDKEYFACRRKQAYSKKEAEEQVILKYAQTGRGGYTYYCGYCGWWHITKASRNSFVKSKQRKRTNGTNT